MEYDLFISHASEDKDNFVRPLAKALSEKGYNIWYDEHSLKLGDSLSEKIDSGLYNSKYGLVILSNYFFEKKWPKRELRGLVALQENNKNKILPIWHNISRNQILKHSPTLADIISVESEIGIVAIVNKITETIGVKEVESSLLRAKVLLEQGHNEMALISAATHLEILLKDLAKQKLGFAFFKKRPIWSYSLGPLLILLLTRQYNKLDSEILRLINSVLYNEKVFAIILPG